MELTCQPYFHFVDYQTWLPFDEWAYKLDVNNHSGYEAVTCTILFIRP